MKSFVLALVATLAVWSGQAAAQQKSHLTRVLESGVLRIGTTGDFFPMSFRDPATKEFKGHQIEAAQKFAADIGVKPEFVLTEWKTLINGLVADKYDIVMTGTSMGMGRAKTAAFTEVWGITGFLPLVQKKNADKYKSWDDLNKPDVSVGASLGTTQVTFIQQSLPNAKLKQVDSPARDWQELLAGHVDVTITSTLEGGGLVQSHPELTMLFEDKIRSTLPLAFIVPQDDVTWLNFVNSWIDISKSTGYFAELNAKWGLAGQK